MYTWGFNEAVGYRIFFNLYECLVRPITKRVNNIHNTWLKDSILPKVRRTSIPDDIQKLLPSWQH